MMAMNEMIDVPDLPAYLHASPPVEQVFTHAPSADGRTLAEQERFLLMRALTAAAGNQSKAARILRIGRDALRYKLKKHNLDPVDANQANATAGAN